MVVELATQQRLSALRLLLKAHEQTQQEGLAYPEVAQSTSELVADGVDVRTLQFLLADAQVRCVPETADEDRNPSAAPQVSPGSRWLLTEAGLDFTRRLTVMPWWQARWLRLWWQGECIKRVRHDAANQQPVLKAFEEASWPRQLASMVPKARTVNVKDWLSNTAKALNKGQHPVLIRFCPDGTGHGLRWEAVT
jgi:hypothetical protein